MTWEDVGQRRDGTFVHKYYVIDEPQEIWQISIATQNIARKQLCEKFKNSLKSISQGINTNIKYQQTVQKILQDFADAPPNKK